MSGRNRRTPSRFGGNAVNVAQGASAVRAGRTFEEELEATHAAPLYAERCAIARAFPPVGGPPDALFYRGPGQVDFVGHVAGVPVAFDAKSNAEQASYKHDPRDYHELDFLLGWRARGGVSFLLILDRSIDTLYLVDDLARLRAGETVALRTHARGRSRPAPVVPALIRTQSERMLDAALGRPVWPWLSLAAMTYASVSRALAEESR